MRPQLMNAPSSPQSIVLEGYDKVIAEVGSQFNNPEESYDINAGDNSPLRPPKLEPSDLLDSGQATYSRIRLPVVFYWQNIQSQNSRHYDLEDVVNPGSASLAAKYDTTSSVAQGTFADSGYSTMIAPSEDPGAFLSHRTCDTCSVRKTKVDY